MKMRCAAMLVVLAGCTRCACAQVPFSGPKAALPTPLDPLARLDPEAAKKVPLYRELDGLRRFSFTTAQQARVSLRVYERGSNRTLLNRLPAEAFTFTVNGTERHATLDGSPETAQEPPLVMLTFPPNQRLVHAWGLKDAKSFFASQPQELLPWKIAVLDSDGSATPFTNSRTQLLTYLETLEQKTEPFVLEGFPTDWQIRAELAISAMQGSSAPKIILAFSPMPEGSDERDEGRSAFAFAGPERLIEVAQRIGAHIYIAKIGGPNYPVGEYLVQGTAAATQGNVLISLKNTAASIQHDLDAGYTFHFALTASDRDHGVPDVAVRVLDRHDYVVVTDLRATPIAQDAQSTVLTRQALDRIWMASEQPLLSPSLQIKQHVDYFPLRAGFQPELPLSGEVRFSTNMPPQDLRIAEFIQDLTLNAPVLEREMEPVWEGHAVSWERDGYLNPGTYLWRVVLHDGKGQVYASSQQRVLVGMPALPSIAASSLVVGKSCRGGKDVNSGLLQKRSDLPLSDQEEVHFQVDPLRVEDCRLKPEASDDFSPGDHVRAFLRLYPSGKLAKLPPERWAAHFVLRSGSGTPVTEVESAFHVDSGSGYVISAEIPLTAKQATLGQGSLELHVTGPGLKKELLATRPISIAL